MRIAHILSAATALLTGASAAPPPAGHPPTAANASALATRDTVTLLFTWTSHDREDWTEPFAPCTRITGYPWSADPDSIVYSLMFTGGYRRWGFRLYSDEQCRDEIMAKDHEEEFLVKAHVGSFWAGPNRG